MSSKQVKAMKRILKRQSSRFANATLDTLLKQKFGLRLQIAWRIIKGEKQFNIILLTKRFLNDKVFKRLKR